MVYFPKKMTDFKLCDVNQNIFAQGEWHLNKW